MTASVKITSPDDPGLDALCESLSDQAAELDQSNAWPHGQLMQCAKMGVFEWFLPKQWGGQEWSDEDIVRGYLRLSAACLTTTFVITQLTGACRRIAACDNDALKERLLPELAAGTRFATLGISHLTTSRRHLARPVLRAEEIDDGIRLDGFSPWVTGAAHADYVVTGATLADDRQVLVTLPMDIDQVTVPPPANLVGLSASQTGQVRLENVHLSRDWFIAGPTPHVMQQGVGAGTGGLQTSTLAIGLATAAVDFLTSESTARADLLQPARQFEEDLNSTRADLLAAASGKSVCTNEQLRIRANELALRSSQAALAAAKGTGYVIGHPVGRWCREALFFLVWSCPQPVMAAHLCALAGIED